MIFIDENPSKNQRFFKGQIRNFEGTIQNDNLFKGNFYGTWLPAKPEDNYMGLLRRFASRNDVKFLFCRTLLLSKSSGGEGSPTSACVVTSFGNKIVS